MTSLYSFEFIRVQWQRKICLNIKYYYQTGGQFAQLACPLRILSVVFLALVGLDPVPEEGHPGVDAGNVAGTADTPGDEADDGPAAGLALADQGRPTVPSAGVLTHLSTGTNLRGNTRVKIYGN